MTYRVVITMDRAGRRYELHEITGHYDDGTYGFEHIGGCIDEVCIGDFADYMVQWVDDNNETHELYANEDGEIVLPDGTIVAIWMQVSA